MQEAYEFESRDIIKKYLKLRYRLFPLLYTLAAETSRTGHPFFKPLFLKYGREFLDVDDQFLFGDVLLVAPVLEKGADKRNVILPEGLWYDFHTGEVRAIEQASQTVELSVTLDDIPIFVQGGSILPCYTYNARSTMDFEENRDMEITVYPDAEGRAAGMIYEDDMISIRVGNNYRETVLEYTQEGNTARIGLSRSGEMKLSRSLVVIVPDSITQVLLNGKTVPVQNGRVTVR